MHRSLFRMLAGIAAPFILCAIAQPAPAQTPAGSAFTYQGLLTQGGNPASGAFDLLDALGVKAEGDGLDVLRCFGEAGVAFCFARSFHAAMRHAGPVRAELGVPTVFNFLGPLSHPGRVRRQASGSIDPRT